MTYTPKCVIQHAKKSHLAKHLPDNPSYYLLLKNEYDVDFHISGKHGYKLPADFFAHHLAYCLCRTNDPNINELWDCLRKLDKQLQFNKNNDRCIEVQFLIFVSMEMTIALGTKVSSVPKKDLIKLQDSIKYVSNFLKHNLNFGLNYGIETHRINELLTYVKDFEKLTDSFGYNEETIDSSHPEFPKESKCPIRFQILLEPALPPLYEILDDISQTVDLVLKKPKVIKQLNTSRAELICFCRGMRQRMINFCGNPKNNIIALIANHIFSDSLECFITEDNVKHMR